MKYTEQEIEDLLEKKEQAAWNIYLSSTGDAFRRLPKPLQDIAKEAFLIGYGYGGIEYENDLRKLQKEDPVSFYKWIEEKL